MLSRASARPSGTEPPPLSHKNNFDLLRFVFAFTVLLVHSYALSRETELHLLARFLSAELAIQGLFIVSGYLVFMSLENSRSVGDYLGKRVRRIYPAYFAVVAGCALLGALVSTSPVAQYFSADLARYLAANLVFLNFLEPNLPGVFRGNPMPEVNGALWTLKIEVMFYAAVPVIGWLAMRLGRGRTLLALYLLAAAYVVGMDWLHRRTGSGFWLILQRQLPGQLGFFVAGAACYYYADALAVLEQFEPTIRSTDVFLSTFPKCGTTLVQNLLYQLREGGDPNLDCIYNHVPWLEYPVDGLSLIHI